MTLDPLFLLALLVAPLATYRLVRLWQTDNITEPLRSRVVGGPSHTGWLLAHGGRFGAWLVELLTCQWCLGIWASFAVLGIITAATDSPFSWDAAGVFLFTFAALAIAATQSLFHLIEDLVTTTLELLEDQLELTEVQRDAVESQLHGAPRGDVHLHGG